MDPTDLIPIIVIAGMVFLGLIAIVGGFLHSLRGRHLLHQERMKALELGRELPDDVKSTGIEVAEAAGSRGAEGGAPALARKCFSTAFWVALVGFIFASQGAWANQGVAIVIPIAIAASAGAIGITAMICGTILATRTPPGPAPGASTKAFVESDAFDVVSRRG
jgi:hypothetical protein